MQLEHRINAFSLLGKFLRQFGSKEIKENEDLPHNELFLEAMKERLQLANTHNGWFTLENLGYACENWAEALIEENITRWLSTYHLNESPNRIVAIIMAGNIPLVGFHDFIAVLLSGNRALIKLSSGDQQLIPLLAKYIIAVEPGFKDYISFTEGKLTDFEAVIATGSNNTALYFDYYFGKYSNIIRKNRNSVAILTGDETSQQLESLAEDIFRYYGMGCRNVSKLYLPTGYKFDAFNSEMETYDS